METLVAAYLAAGVVVSTYATWMALQNHRLARRLAELQALPPEQASDRPAHIQAA